MSALTWAGVARLGAAGGVARFVVDGAVAGRSTASCRSGRWR
jgi:hypothetical protein